MASIPVVPTFAGGSFLTAAEMNVVSSALDTLSGDAGVVEFRDGIEVGDGNGDRYIALSEVLTSAPTGTGTAGQLVAASVGGQTVYYYSDGNSYRALESDNSVVTYGNLSSNGDVGNGASQVAAGNHSH